MRLGFLLLAACSSSWNLPRDAEIPRPGDLTRAIGALDETVERIEIYVHPHDDQRALIGGYLGNAWILWLADAERGEVRRVCEDFDDARVRPIRVGWRNEAALWDEVDGQVVLLSAGSWPDWDFYRCGDERLPERVTFLEMSAWSGTSALSPDGLLTWEHGEDHPVHLAWADPEPSPLPSIGAPVLVVKRHDALGLWALLHDAEAGTLSVIDVDATTLESQPALTVDLGGETFVEARHLHPDALVFYTREGLRGASAAAGGAVHDLSSLDLGGTPLLYPDGTSPRARAPRASRRCGRFGWGCGWWSTRGARPPTRWSSSSTAPPRSRASRCIGCSRVAGPGGWASARRACSATATASAATTSTPRSWSRPPCGSGWRGRSTSTVTARETSRSR